MGTSRDPFPGPQAPGGDPLLATRFSLPVVPGTYVRRPRLTERLAQGVRGPLTLVAGAAGAGKTLLVADWARTAGAADRTAWLTVEPEDHAPGVFWTYVLAALRAHGLTAPAGPGNPGGTGRPGASGGPGDPRGHDGIGTPVRPGEVDRSLLARLAARLSDGAGPLVLVLDEFDRVAGCAELADELQFVLRHSGGGLRLIVVSRTEPLLPLHRYRAAGEVTDIRGADLAFRPDETAALLDRHGMTLSGAGIHALTERTGGWAAGLRLCVLAAQRAEDPETFLKEFEAGRSTLADYLLAEVLDAQPRATQELLLRCSVLERIHPDLADALTGRRDAATVLAGLQRANAFLDATGHSWYRLHPLFAEILRVHLRVREPGREPELHRTAAHRLAEAGLLAEALPHAAAAGDWAFAAGLLVEDLGIARLLTGLDAERLDTLFARMPPDVPGPAADLVRAARDLGRHDADRGLAELYRAAAALHREGAPASDALRLSCALLRVLAARTTGAADLAETAALEAEAARLALAPERLAAHPELPALILGNLGSAQLWAGRLDAARATLTAAAEADDTPSTAYLRHDCLGRLAFADILRGRPGPARAHARRALDEAEGAGLPPGSCAPAPRLVLAAVAVERDELGVAHGHLEQAAASASTTPHDPVVAAGLVLLRARLRLAEGAPEAALAELEGLEKPSPALEPSPWVREHAALTGCAAHLAAGRPEAALRVFEERPPGTVASRTALARAHLACGSPRAALDLLDELPGVGGEGPAITVRTLLTRAAAADALGDTVTAQRLVSRALRLARPDRLRRPLLEAGPWLRRLLRAAPHLTRGHTWLPAAFAARPAPAAPAGGAPPTVVEALSEREREVLQRLAQLLSTEEIAADLYLSVNTVKTHLKSVYRKLGASRRGEAVRRARDLHLL
ncbi:LuxR C-terminal-related transcriptional regulator [Streptomyces sp. NPDC047000]|uniref:LuxR C-terminal-related transcriptional regulator n=1 Tax=Streptomyces sp. NPDC047000 TaxID=3155474 RepID=UPI00340C2401